MAARTLVTSLCLAAAGCRDPNPYFVEPPLTTTGAASSSGGDATAPTDDDDDTADPPTSTTATTTGGSGSASAETGVTATTTGTTGGACGLGEIVCDGNIEQVCDGAGSFLSVVACDAVCVDDLGCADCEPGSGRCVGDLAQACAADGTWSDVEACDPLQGMACELGACLGACSKETLGLSHLGCDFYAATLANLHDEEPQWTGQFGLAIVNAGGEPAVVTVTRGPEQVTAAQVPADGVETITLAYVDALAQSGPTDTGPSLVVADGAYRVRSSRPVTIYAFEPLAAADTGDASLLLPVHAWGTRHVVAAHQHRVSVQDVSLPGWYAVIAGEDGTQVTLTPSATGDAVAAGAGVDASGAGVVVLDAGDVLEVLSASKFMFDDTDLTGTIVDADRPVTVLGGHKCAAIPYDTITCDHLEESMPSVSALGYDYVVAPSRDPFGEVEPHVIRVVATEDDTTLVYDPPLDAADLLADAGDWIDLTGIDALRITADRKVLVAQYMTSSNDAGIDPSLTIAVPIAQFRQAYGVFTSGGYAYSGMTVIAPALATVTLDGVPLADGDPIGASGYAAVSIDLGGGSGTYRLDGDMPFGVEVHGYDSMTSYWMPGGLGLAAVP